ncbi:MAG: exo-alpha-sialidase [Clostridia bacterium]|nr:exo-alpha-sialidase [Clostridia bacterium]
MEEKLIFSSSGRSNYRIPSVIFTKHGTALAFSNDRKDSISDCAAEMSVVLSRRAKDGEWSEPRTLVFAKDVACIIGSAVYDADTDEAIVFFRRCFVRNEFVAYSEDDIKRMDKEDELRARNMGIRLGDFVLKSIDDGLTWKEEPLALEAVPYTHIDGSTRKAAGFTHGAAHGIQLKRGEHDGRLVCPSRIFEGSYKSLSEICTHVYNNAIYSDDHGKTWRASKPVQIGTGEGTLIERGDGSILYNSRAYFGDGKRYLATSIDGGETYGDFRTDGFLTEEINCGCNASFLRVTKEELGAAASFLPSGADSITLFVNPRAKTRRNMTVAVSFDDAENWHTSRVIFDGECAYSSLDYSSRDGIFCLIYEKGKESDPYALGISAVIFDLEWLLS